MSEVLTKELPKSTIAAIDLGTNSAHMVIAEMDHIGQMHVLDVDKVHLRLGAALDAKGDLTRDAIVKTTETFRHMYEIISPYNATIRAVATHAAREAKNYKLLLTEIERIAHIHVEIIDGIEEARLAFLGMRYGLALNSLTCLGIDVGGGSSEIIIAQDDDISFVASYKLGAVTLTDRYFSKSGYTSSNIKAMRDHIRTTLSPLSHEAQNFPFQKALAASGTAKALAFIHAKSQSGIVMSDPNGYIIPTEDLQYLREYLSKLLDPHKIKEATGIDESRSEILLAGTMILEEICLQLGVKEIIVTSYGLREGLVADTFYRINGEKSHEMPDIQWHSVLQFSKQLKVDQTHAFQVKKLALKIYQQLIPLIKIPKADTRRGFQETHNLDDEDQDTNIKLLKGAAYLREAGKFLSSPQYHKHSQYLIAHRRLPGFTESERQFMGLIARFQRKAPPHPNHRECKDLNNIGIKRLRILSGIVRLAAALDRTRQNRIKDVLITKQQDTLKITLVHAVSSPPDVEIHKALLELPALEKSFDLKLEFETLTESQ